MLDVVSPHTAGEPTNSQKWLNCRLADIQEYLEKRGHGISLPVISRLLKENNYSLKSNSKQQASKEHPDRDKQFEYLRYQREKHQAKGQPVISVDTKNKELVGNFKNSGQIWCQVPEVVNTYDFPSLALGKAVPYGIYDLQENHGTVYVGQSADTPTFTVDNIASWCQAELFQHHSNPISLMIEADGGGSNGYRSRVWKRDLQNKVADAFNLIVTVCHYPRGASKWNPVEHRLFSEISKTWAGCPLRSFQDVLFYINDTRTKTGLTVQAHLVTKTYKRGVKVPNCEMDALDIRRHEICPLWNYTIYPRLPSL